MAACGTFVDVAGIRQPGPPPVQLHPVPSRRRRPTPASTPTRPGGVGALPIASRRCASRAPSPRPRPTRPDGRERARRRRHQAARPWRPWPAPRAPRRRADRHGRGDGQRPNRRPPGRALSWPRGRGEVQPGVLRRRREPGSAWVEETAAAAEVPRRPGRVPRLRGLRDDGRAHQRPPGTFWTADLDEAADRLAAILRDERVDVLTVYDEHGNYGHPDHIQVNRVGHLAAERAGIPRAEATMDRDFIREGMAEAAELGGPAGRLRAAGAHRGQPVRQPRRGHHPRGGRDRLRGTRSAGPCPPRQPGARRLVLFLAMDDDAFQRAFGSRSGSSTCSSSAPGRPGHRPFEGMP